MAAGSRGPAFRGLCCAIVLVVFIFPVLPYCSDLLIACQTLPAAAPAATPTKKRKMKKIDVSSIADKINKTKSSKSKEEKEAEKSKKSALHPPLPQFGKKPGRKKHKKSEKKQDVEAAQIIGNKKIKVPEYTTIDELARSMDVPAVEIIKTCLGIGMMVVNTIQV